MLEDVFGLLCEGRLATMSELLDPTGPWSLDLMATMAPVAMIAITRRKKAFFRSIMCGIAALSSGGGAAATDYAAELDAAEKRASDGQRERNGETLPTKEEEGAEALLTLLKSIPTKKG